jgi:hypothetical protein
MVDKLEKLYYYITRQQAVVEIKNKEKKMVKPKVKLKCTQAELNRLKAAKNALVADSEGGGSPWVWDTYVNYAYSFGAGPAAERNHDILVKIWKL